MSSSVVSKSIYILVRSSLILELVSSCTNSGFSQMWAYPEVVLLSRDRSCARVSECPRHARA